MTDTTQNKKNTLNKTKKMTKQNMIVIFFNRFQKKLNKTYKLLGIDLIKSTVEQIHYAFTHITPTQKKILKKLWGSMSPTNPKNAKIFENVITNSKKTLKSVTKKEVPFVAQYNQFEETREDLRNVQKGGNVNQIGGINASPTAPIPSLDQLDKISDNSATIDKKTEEMNKKIEEVGKEVDAATKIEDLNKPLENMVNTGIMREFISKFVNLTSTEINKYVKSVSSKGIMIIQNMIEVVPVFGEIFALVMVLLNGTSIGLKTTQLGVKMYNVLNKKFNPLFELIKKFMRKTVELNKKMQNQKKRMKKRKIFSTKKIPRILPNKSVTMRAPVLINEVSA